MAHTSSLDIAGRTVAIIQQFQKNWTHLNASIKERKTIATALTLLASGYGISTIYDKLAQVFPNTRGQSIVVVC